MLGDINYDLAPQKYEITLCKPNFTREQIAILTEAYNISYSPKLASIDELTFTIPYYIKNNNNIIVENEHFTMLKGDYIILLNNEQYFVITQPDNEGEEERTVKNVTCYSLEYELSRKLVRGYKANSRKLYDLTNTIDENGIPLGILNYITTLTSWSIDTLTIPAELLTKYRSFDISEASILDVLNEIQKSFGCYFNYDTINKKIIIKTIDTIGINRGLYIAESNYIKTVGQVIKHDEIVTRLRCYGKNNISINSVVATGDSGIEDFGYYKTTDYMSQELIDALNAYEALLADKTGSTTNPQAGTFNFYLQQLANYQQEYDALYTQPTVGMNDLKIQLKVIQDGKDVAMQEGTYNGYDYAYWVNQESLKQAEINNKQAEINAKQSQIDNVNYNIRDLKATLSKANNFTATQLKELDYFIREKTWSDSNYDNPQDLYNEGVKALQKANQPPIEFTISIVDFLQIIECQHDWDKLVVGDLINVSYPKFVTDFEVRLIGYTHQPESNSLQLQFSNKENLDNPYVYMSDLLKQAISSSNTLDMSKYKWDMSEDNNTSINQILNNAWDASKNAILGGSNQNQMFNDRGFFLTNKNSPLEQIGMINNCIAFTKNNWTNVALAITPDGVFAPSLFGQVIAGENLQIVNTAGTFRVDGDGATISGMALNITGGLPEGQINSSTVNKWNSMESNAKSYTDGQITEINNTLGVLQQDIDNFSSDGKMTLAEANALETSLIQVNNESTDIINIATTLSITTAKTNYSNALTALTNELNNNWINKSNYPLTISTAQRTNLQTLFQNVQNTKSILINAITARQAQSGKDAWSKFTGTGNTLPSGNVEFTFAGSTTKGGNALDVDKVNGKNASEIKQSVINFDSRNDRKSTTPANPTIANTGTAIDHTLNTDGSVDISFEWTFTGTGDAYDIDGFIVYMYQKSTNTAYTFGTDVQNETVFYITPDKRAFIVYGLASDKYYTFGVQSYRIVDQDINSTGVLKSSIVVSSASGENPYLPSATVAFSGDVTGTVAGTSATAIKDKATNSVQLGTVYNNLKFDATNGISVKRSDNKTQTLLNATDGFKIQGSTDGGVTWGDKLFADTNGNLSLTGVVKAIDFQNINGQSILSADKTKIEGSSIKADTLTVNSANITGTITADTVKANWIYTNDISATQITTGTLPDTRISSASTWNTAYSKASNSVQLGDLYNYIKISQTGGLQVFDYTGTERARLGNISSGIYGLQLSNSIGQVTFSTDSNGNIGLGGKLYQINSPSRYATVGGSYADFNLYRDSSTWFRIEDNFTNFALKACFNNVENYGLEIGASATYPLGVWNFNNCTVTGLNITAKFA